MDDVSKVREKVDIVSLIASYIPLKKMGSNFKANCPFHSESTPSFVVSPQRQIWHCFGCGKGGDCFSFLMEYEHMEFPEALRALAQKTGVQLSSAPYDSGVASEKETIYVLNALACEYYHFLLTKHEVGKDALQYVEKERRVSVKTIETYKLGFAPGSGVALVNYLQKKKKYTPEQILSAGLATKRVGGITDFFSGRLIFPLLDHRGNIIGFSGRILSKSTTVSKYINTRETLVYHKGSVFFGLDSAKDAIKKENKAIIMEGELDVIASFQEGVTNAVAIKGTALTKEQVQLLSRFTNMVSLCLDSDTAGQNAMKRSLPILGQLGMTTTLIQIPHGKDPADAIQEDVVAFKQAVKHARPILDVILETLLVTFDPATAIGKKNIATEMLTYLSFEQNEIVKEHYIKQLATTISTSTEVLQRELEHIIKKEIVKKEVTPPKEVRSRVEILEEYVVSLVVQYAHPEKLLGVCTEFLQEYAWENDACGKILVTLQAYLVQKKAFVVEEFLRILPHALVPEFDQCFLQPIPHFSTDDYYMQEVKKLIDELTIMQLKREIKALTDNMQLLEKTNQEEELQKLQDKLTPLLAKLSQHTS